MGEVCTRITYNIYVLTFVDRMKASGEQIDDRVVEVHWDPEEECWRMMRFRDDKPHGNHKDVIEKILDSIADGVGKDIVCSLEFPLLVPCCSHCIIRATDSCYSVQRLSALPGK